MQTLPQTFVFGQHAPLMQVVVLLGQQMLPHRVKPALHAKPQTPFVHVAVALAGAAHLTPQAPQLFTSVAVCVSQPFVSFSLGPPSQLA